MRIWDINPGYLNRQSLLGEHRELHAIVSIKVNKKKGYSRHPETLRWLKYGWALKQRHRLLSAEMRLRGFVEKSPVRTQTNKGIWPGSFIDEPQRQFQILAGKYEHGKQQGRIPLPGNGQQLWSHHKYSILARDQTLYRKIGQELSAFKPHDDYSPLALTLAQILRCPPSPGGIRNALQHMWGYVSDYPPVMKEIDLLSHKRLLKEIQIRAVNKQVQYLLCSTALSELEIWL